MQRFRFVVGVPLAVFVAAIVLGNLVGWHSGYLPIQLGVLASGLIAGRLAGWRTGVGAAAVYIALVVGFFVVGLALTDPAHFS